jgi:hypothetical protein
MANVALNLAVGLVGQLLYAMFKPTPPDIEGARLDDLNIPAINPGRPINRVWGEMKVNGQIIWSSGLKETKHSKRVKGGKGGKRQKQHSYTYSTNVAVAVCVGPARILSIHGREKVIWEAADQAAEDDYATALAAYTAERHDYYTLYYSSPLFIYNNTPAERDKMRDDRVAYDVAQWKKKNQEDNPKPEYESLKIYTGDDTQLPDSTMEAFLGVGEVPAYRGLCYFVFDELQLADFGRAIPTFRVRVEVQRNGKPPTVADIIVDLCDAVGLNNGTDFKVNPTLENMQLGGFAISRIASARQSIEQLQVMHPFDVIEAGDKLVFRNRDRLPVGIIDWDDMRAHTRGSLEIGNKLERTHIDDPQLPKSIKISFQDASRDYSSNQVKATRSMTRSTSVQTQDLPISSTPTVMKKAAETAMTILMAQRNGYAFKLPAKYLRFQVGDVVQLPVKKGQYRTVRLTQADIGTNFIMDVKAVDHVLTESGIAAIAMDGDSIISTVNYPADTRVHVLDCPSLTDDELDTGVYVVFSADTSNWDGGALYRDILAGSSTPMFGTDASTPAGTEWELQVTGTEYVASGTVLNLLPPPISVDTLDTETEMKVIFWTANPSFVSQTYESMLGSTDNVFMVDGEIIQAQTVQQIDAQTFIFTNLLRGRRGTDYAAYNHAINDTIVELRPDAIERWDIEPEYVDAQIDWRGATQGLDVMAQPTQSFVFEANHLKAFGPAATEVMRLDDGELRMTLHPRARYGGQWLGGSTTTSPDKDEYTVYIYDGPAYLPSSNVVQTISLVGTKDFAYTAAQQITDFGTTQDQIYVKITQVSADNREGLPRFATL